MAHDREAKPLPTLLSKSDVLLYAATQLEAMISDMRLINMMADVSKRLEVTQDPKTNSALSDIKVLASGIIDMELQERVLREGAAELRSIANEQKLVEARAASRGIRAS